MLHALQQASAQIGAQINTRLAPALMERATLLANHVLASEPVATARLQAHVGKSMQVIWQGVPAFLPPPPPMCWRITPAGLLEWRADAGATELVLRVDASQPAQLVGAVLAGAFPEASIEGDAALATDVGWLTQNLRWDLAADLERVFPSPVVQGLTQAGAMAARALRSALSRWKPGGATDSQNTAPRAP
jgi:ubiquinone biosynthesis accessory factor UbiJ